MKKKSRHEKLVLFYQTILFWMNTYCHNDHDVKVIVASYKENHIFFQKKTEKTLTSIIQLNKLKSVVFSLCLFLNVFGVM